MEGNKKQEWYCKLFIDASKLERDELSSLVLAVVNGHKGQVIETHALSVDIRSNDDYNAPKYGHKIPYDSVDEFLYYRYFLDIFPKEEDTDRKKYVDEIGTLLEGLWARKYKAVAACGFEEKLPRAGGMGYDPTKNSSEG